MHGQHRGEQRCEWWVARQILGASLFCLLLSSSTQGEIVGSLVAAPSRVVLDDGSRAATEAYDLMPSMTEVPPGDQRIIQWTLRNQGDQPLEVKEIVLYDWEHGLPADCEFYGEGYTMLTQTGGTLGKMEPLSRYLDSRHYRLPAPAGFHAAYGMMTVGLPDDQTLALGFTSCRRCMGKFHVGPQRIQVVVDTEGLVLKPGQSWELEELLIAKGPDRNALLEQLAVRIERHHPRLKFERLPTGWCSWYCFGPRVTAQNVVDNLRVIQRDLPELRFVQIDDGYQPWMGDWLETGDAFGGGVQDVLGAIREAGLEPAIWVAPFVASPESRLFREHPDWFIQDDDGRPLRSDKVTFRGWRLGPWYMLDGSHPEAQQYLEHVFRTMREDWGCTYFKLDANTWGAMPFGLRHDPQATAVEAYRQGMAAIRRGAGDAFILGCNHPIWPSLGEIHGSRSSADISRRWDRFESTGRQNLMRNWQNDRLWWNDPDCLVLSGSLPPEEYNFHKSLLYATGGMVLSGDDLTKLSESQRDVIRTLAASPGIAATFDSSQLKVGTINRPDRTLYVLLNWSKDPEAREIELSQPSRLIDVWGNKDLGKYTDKYVIENLPPHSGRLIAAEPFSP